MTMKFPRFLLLMVLGTVSISAQAGYICMPVGGAHIFNYSSEKTLSDVGKDSVGKVIEDAFTFDLAGDFSTTGCSGSGPAYITATSNLPSVGTDSEGREWFKVNEYLAVSMMGYISGNQEDYFKVPFISVSNKYDAAENDGDGWQSGSKGKISLKILKPFVGVTYFNTELMHTQISLSPYTGAVGPYVSSLMMSGTINVPQTCVLNFGENIEMNFGNISSTAFVKAGAGHKPEGVNPIIKNFFVKCKNVDAFDLLSLRIEANNVKGDIIVSDNPDLGFVVGDSKQNPLTPNDIDSKVPFRVNGSSSAIVSISAWPVSVTGNKPEEGKFTSEGYLRVDFY